MIPKRVAVRLEGKDAEEFWKNENNPDPMVTRFLLGNLE